MRTFSKQNLSRILFVTGVLFLLSEVFKQVWINLVLKPEEGYCWWYFPFQLCSTPMYVCLLMPFTEKKDSFDALCTYLATYGTVAGTAAFMDTSGFTELGSLPVTVHSFVWHIAMILVGLVCFGYLSGNRCSSFSGATLLYMFFAGIAELINVIMGRTRLINMFYISPYLKMNQAVFKSIASYAGNNWGIVCYLLCTVLGALTVEILLLLREPAN